MTPCLVSNALQTQSRMCTGVAVAWRSVILHSTAAMELRSTPPTLTSGGHHLVLPTLTTFVAERKLRLLAEDPIKIKRKE